MFWMSCRSVVCLRRASSTPWLHSALCNVRWPLCCCLSVVHRLCPCTQARRHAASPGRTHRARLQVAKAHGSSSRQQKATQRLLSESHIYRALDAGTAANMATAVATAFDVLKAAAAFKADVRARCSPALAWVLSGQTWG